MSDFNHLKDFLEPVSMSKLSEDEGYREGQLGKTIRLYDEELPDIEDAHVIIVGCPEERGEYILPSNLSAPDAIRQHFYSLYNWHKEIRIVDIGNIKKGNSMADSHAALKLVLRELYTAGKTVIILGGSHDNTLAQYQAYAAEKRMIEAVCVDAKIDIDMESPRPSDHFLMEMLTGEPNYLKHYNHIAFQSYYVHPHMLETMDKLRFDCFRVGHVRDNIEEMEPVFRSADMMSFDISAIAHAYAPANHETPNGLSGEDACMLTRFAGMSPSMSSIGIYGYSVAKDSHQLTAKQIGQMLWYFVDGMFRGMKEADLKEKNHFNEFHIAFGEIETTFLQSKKTGRWWMQLPDQQFIACSYEDYLRASRNEMPERWIRAQERSL